MFEISRVTLEVQFFLDKIKRAFRIIPSALIFKLHWLFGMSVSKEK